MYSNLAEGAYSLTAKAVDAAGNTDASGASFNWVVTTIPPVTSITAAVPANAVSNLSTILLYFNSTKAGSFLCALDGAPAQTCVSPMTYTQLPDGKHNFHVNAVDFYGLADPVGASYAWSVDTAAPTPSIDLVIPAASMTSAQAISIQFSANETSTFECSLDGTASQSCSSPVALNALTEGVHSFFVTAIDTAGNRSTPATYAWTTDYTAPLIAISSVNPPVEAPSNQNSVSVAFSASEQPLPAPDSEPNPLRIAFAFGIWWSYSPSSRRHGWYSSRP